MNRLSSYIHRPPQKWLHLKCMNAADSNEVLTAWQLTASAGWQTIKVLWKLHCPGLGGAAPSRCTEVVSAKYVYGTSWFLKDFTSCPPKIVKQSPASSSGREQMSPPHPAILNCGCGYWDQTHQTKFVSSLTSQLSILAWSSSNPRNAKWLRFHEQEPLFGA